MKLTTRTRYAVRALIDLVNQPDGKPNALHEIAQRQGVKLRYLEQIFLKLRRARLIASKKGPGGGYFVNRSPKSIRLSEIMRAVGESTAPVFCVAENHQKECIRMQFCPARPYWRKLKQVIDNFFNAVTLDDMSKIYEREKSESKKDIFDKIGTASSTKTCDKGKKGTSDNVE